MKRINHNTIFVDLSEPLSEENQKAIDPVEMLNARKEVLYPMAMNGFLSSARKGNSVFYFKDHKFQTFLVRFQELKMLQDPVTKQSIFLDAAGREVSDNRTIVSSLRQFIAKWILGKSKIENNRVVQQFIYLYTYSLHLTISVPTTWVEEFQKDAQAARFHVLLVSPKIMDIRCSFCGAKFRIESNDKHIKCPICLSDYHGDAI